MSLNTKAKSLIQLTKTIMRYEKLIAHESGENFNLFNILGVKDLELKHSLMLAELLDPEGSHAQGSLFLKLFLEHFKIHDFPYEGAKVQIEKFVGKISDDYEHGGRIDILISNGSKSKILIENKVHTDDQDNQLTRYQNSYKESTILYLTLYGTSPSEKSISKSFDKTKLLCASYSSDIIAWLELCRNVAVTKPAIRESITQYIHILRTLTHQNTQLRMSQQITDAALQNRESLEAFFAIRNSHKFIQSHIQSKLKSQLQNLAIKVELTLSEFDDDLEASRETGFCFTSTRWPQELEISFVYEAKDFHKMFIGILNIDKLDNKRIETLSLAKEYLPNATQNTHWLILKRLTDVPIGPVDTFTSIQEEKYVSYIEPYLYKMKSICDKLSNF